MASVPLFVFFLLSQLVLLHSADGKWNHPNCASFHCEKLGSISFPFANSNSYCGLCPVDCDETTPMIQLGRDGRSYDVINISQSNTSYATIRVKDQVLQEHLKLRRCELLSTLTFPNSNSISFEVTSPNQTLGGRCEQHDDHCHLKGIAYRHRNNPKIMHLCRCDLLSNLTLPNSFEITIPNQTLLYTSTISIFLPLEILKILLLNVLLHLDDLFTFLTAEYDLEVLRSMFATLKGKILLCHCRKRYRHSFRSFNSFLFCLGIGCQAIIICLLFFMWHHYKKKHASSELLRRNTYSGTFSKSDLEVGSIYFGVPVFSYSELEEATNNFDLEKELGDGGFGTVYHGKLHDGREVAVKRLYEHNYRRVEQFMNEVKILTRLHHKNLVSLYGCTSHHSRELLLVYEYIPNGTVADHIHGHRATPSSLTWPTPINKIEKCAFHELVDPHLGFESDNEVKRMIILISKLAFQCIQQDKEMRPSMYEVFEALKKIQSGEDALDVQENAYIDAEILNVQQPTSPDCYEVGLLKTKQLPPSPYAVTDNWTLRSTTPNVSGLISSTWC
ncbi:leaf rust 10 disease-resistance locus receptor-like protein kinase-like 1.1 [Quercus suber]|uniref:Leaf rust 10 disease-resistance locus receptor-like protein kinase-like 1.1 n=1 Tax=Quercus suber TaxID=58331 RepID=A0AAW0KRF9_QUESU